MVTTEQRNKKLIEDGENKQIMDSDKKNFLEFDLLYR